MKKQRYIQVILVVVIFTISTSLFAQSKYEMRAAWIATVANIDWPQRNTFDPSEQRAQMISILDSLAALNFNTVILQARPMTDAFYESELEGWSHFLTGQQGVAPSPFYDPLAFVIHEAHKRQIEVHVWLNPYRVLNVDNIKLLSHNHIYYRQPQLFVKYGNQYYFNPGLDKTREYLVDVVSDIVRRYDIDAVHFDDYFYPYPIANLDFPDQRTFDNYPRGFTDKSAWRRNNVDLIIQELSTAIKKIKPWVEFGISPFGVWRNIDKDPLGSKTTAGQTNYDDLYADVRLWLEKGWIDYVTPQLYWEIGKKAADYKELVGWWSRNSFNSNLYIGVAPYKLTTSPEEAWKTPNEICRQLQLNKNYTTTKGAMFFSTTPLLENRLGLCDSLQYNYYKYPALVPANKNIDGYESKSPKNLRIEKFGIRDYLMWDEVYDAGAYEIFYYVVYMFNKGETINIDNSAKIVMKTDETCIDLSSIDSEFLEDVYFVVTSVNRFHKESKVTTILGYTFEKDIFLQ
ncbi:MAG: family 10 glycosylhydrolase [bacterium]